MSCFIGFGNKNWDSFINSAQENVRTPQSLDWMSPRQYRSSKGLVA